MEGRKRVEWQDGTGRTGRTRRMEEDGEDETMRANGSTSLFIEVSLLASHE